MCPIGNFLISYYMSDIRNQLGLSQLSQILPLIPPIDWIWNGLIALSGILILQRRKLSWLVAIGSIFLCTLINIYKFVAFPDVPFGWGYLLMTMMVSMGAVLAIGYFRYPYLDRRDRWVSLNRRTDVQIPVKLLPGPAGVIATNISMTGAKLKFPGHCDYVEDQTLNLEFENHSVEARVVWVGDVLAGVAFQNPSREFKSWIATKITVKSAS